MICGLKWQSGAYREIACELNDGHQGDHYWSKGPKWSWISRAEADRRGLKSLKQLQQLVDPIPVDRYKEDFLHYQRQLFSPPDGWFTFGTHIDQPGVELDFWGLGNDGLPIWERPKQ